ncbi:MAG: substrate-binding domain-containing protein [Bacillota bacterium]|nr:substrate-binding domain-containing protein [Bacillota bacterium]
MSINVIIEPDYASTLWCKQYLEGIYIECELNNALVHIVDINNFVNNDQNLSTTHVLLIGTSISWIPQSVALLSEQKTHCILLAYGHSMIPERASSIIMDYKQAIGSLMQYLASHGKNRISLFGINPDSSNDRQKYQAFIQQAYSNGATEPDKNVFWNHGRLQDSCLQFYKVSNQYDAVIGANDAASIVLINYLKRKGVQSPDDLYVTGIGDTTIARMVRPTITTAKLDYIEAGKKAVQIYNFLQKYPGLTSLTATINCNILVGESTANQPIDNWTEHKSIIEKSNPVPFYNDPDVVDVLNIEYFISRCDDIDVNILKGIAKNMKYFDLADELHISENTVKYRVKRMLGHANLESREQLIDLLLKYFNWNE